MSFKVVPLTKKEAKMLVDDTDSIFNILVYSENKVLFPDTPYYNFLTNWYKKLKIINPNAPQYVINDRISKVMGFKPQFHALYGSENYRNAVWGVRVNNKADSAIFVFNSKKGTAVQSLNMNADEIQNFFAWLMR